MTSVVLFAISIVLLEVSALLLIRALHRRRRGYARQAPGRLTLLPEFAPGKNGNEPAKAHADELPATPVQWKEILDASTTFDEDRLFPHLERAITACRLLGARHMERLLVELDRAVQERDIASVLLTNDALAAEYELLRSGRPSTGHRAAA